MGNVLVSLSSVGLSLPGPEGSVDILRDVSLNIHAGETVSLVGPSGSGKTSLMMIIAGAQDVTKGVVRINGVDVNPLTEDQRAALRRESIGIVFQSFHLIPTMTALENTMIPLDLASGERTLQDKQAEAKKMLEAVGLGHRIQHYPSALSGGEQQRVALARALIAKPKLLLADEPTGNLDGKTGEMIIQLLFDLAQQQGTALLLVTHDSTLAQRCGRQIQLQDGCVVRDSAEGAAA